MIRNIKLNLTERQKLGLLIIGLAVILSVSILPVLKRKKPSGTGPGTTGVEIQDPETVAPESSKIKAYRSSSNGNAERMWSDLQDSQEDPYRESAEESSTQKARGTTADAMYGDITSQPRRSPERETAQTRASSRGGEPRPGDSGYREYRMKQYYDNTDATVRRGEAVKDSIMSASSREDVPEPQDDAATVIGDSAPVRRSSAMSTLDTNLGQGFSSLSADDDKVPTDEKYPFECMFVRAEKVRNGSRVSVRLLEDMVVGGTLIPKNTHLMAMCAISERLNLTVSSVEMNSKIYQLGYEAYDTDGGKGIYCPDLGGDTRRSVKSRGFSAIGRVIGGRRARLASEAVQTGVSVAQSKSGEVTVSVPSGYRFFIVRKQR